MPDAPMQSSASHQSVDKTLHHLQQHSCWVGMATDVEHYCRECLKCEQIKQPNPPKAPLISTPIGQPWEIVADVVQVPISLQSNKYLMVVQDYFTKWAEAIPHPDQTALRINKELIKLFSVFGILKILP